MERQRLKIFTFLGKCRSLTFVEKISGKEVSGLLERLVGLLAGRDNGKDSKKLAGSHRNVV